MDLLRQNSTMREELGMLSVMEALAEREQITQRELSHKTGLNLKKVNYCLHKLLEKGYVKFQRILHNPDKRAYLYVMTPAGIKAKSQLTYRFLKFSLEFYNHVEAKLDRCLVEMQEAGIERIVLYGISEAVRVVIDQANGRDLEVVGILDEDSSRRDYSGLPVLTPADLETVAWDGLLVTALADWEEVEKKLQDLSLPEEKVWYLS